MKRTLRSLAASALTFAIVSISSARAHAVATFELVDLDPPGAGFNDMTPATPVGGNMGTTLGEQRRIAFDRALEMWGRVLESDVPIVVAATFDPAEFECTNGFAALGHAGSSSVQFDVPGVDPDIILTEALADQIAGMDLAPGLPDIEAAFNGGIADCIDGFDWYYGLDATSPRNTANLLQVVLHEIAHGLGFTTFVDPETGEDLSPGRTDPFTMLLFDLATEKHWSEMTPEERVISGSTPRGLVWDGQYANDAARAVLLPGAPHITTTPEVAGLRDMLMAGNFGRPLQTPIVGSVAAAPVVQCGDPVSGVSGAIAISPGDTCHPMNLTYSAEQAGAIATLITTEALPPENFDVPVEDLAEIPLNTTALEIHADDAELLLAATGVMVTLSADMAQLNGADPEGRLYMYASLPLRSSSTASHFDPMARPDLTMEPAESTNPRHDITVDRALLRDVGWRTLCGNGMPDTGEECDNGATNSDTVADACRTTCRRASCGDGVVDTGETCDPGSGAGADPMCTSTCTRPVCGNGMREGAEECDSGAANSNTTPNACRTTCENPSCGDGVVDNGEACDDAATPATCMLCMVTSTGTGGSAGSGAAGSAGNVSSGAGGTAADPPKNKDGGDDDDGGCGCRVSGSRPASSSYALLLAAVVLGLRRRGRDGRRAI